MNLSKSFSIGLAVLITLAVWSPNALAHNSAKYTNFPFVVPGACQQFDSGVSAKFVNSGRTFNLVCVGNGEGDAGFEIYCSAPATGTLPANAAGTIPQGTMTCNISGLPVAGEIFSTWWFSDGTSNDTVVTPVNGSISITTTPNGGTTPGASVIALQMFILNGSGSPTGVYSTVTFNNFKYNTTSVYLDTTNVDTVHSGINFCTK